MTNILKSSGPANGFSSCRLQDMAANDTRRLHDFLSCLDARQLEGLFEKQPPRRCRRAGSWNIFYNILETLFYIFGACHKISGKKKNIIPILESSGIYWHDSWPLHFTMNSYENNPTASSTKWYLRNRIRSNESILIKKSRHQATCIRMIQKSAIWKITKNTHQKIPNIKHLFDCL